MSYLSDKGPTAGQTSFRKEEEMFDISPDVLAVMIPIFAIIGVFATVITSIVVNGKHKELEHKERLIAMEKGIPIPEPPKKEKPPRYLAIRAWGLVFTFLGIVLTVAIAAQTELKYGLWGLLPVAIGVALVMSAHYEKNEMMKGGGQ